MTKKEVPIPPPPNYQLNSLYCSCMYRAINSYIVSKHFMGRRAYISNRTFSQLHLFHSDLKRKRTERHGSCGLNFMWRCDESFVGRRGIYSSIIIIGPNRPYSTQYLTCFCPPFSLFIVLYLVNLRERTTLSLIDSSIYLAQCRPKRLWLPRDILSPSRSPLRTAITTVRPILRGNTNCRS